MTYKSVPQSVTEFYSPVAKEAKKVAKKVEFKIKNLKNKNAQPAQEAAEGTTRGREMGRGGGVH